MPAPFVALALALQPAAAAGVSSAPPVSDAKADPIICRRLTPTGTRLPAKPTCATKSQWDKASADGAENLSRIQGRRDFQFGDRPIPVR